MTTNPHADMRSERGVALVIVLLLMAVLSGLATGFSMNGRIEATMAENEVYYAGARAAAEAGINRATAAIRLEDAVHLLHGQDGLNDPINPAAAENADNGSLAFLMTGASPYPLDAAGQYTYEVEVLDDDDPALYDGAVLSAAQLLAMGGGVAANAEDGSPNNDVNTRLILRATGFGPSNTRVTVSRVLLTTITPIPGTAVNPAILVDGDVNVDGNLSLLGDHGSIHSNGDLTISGNSATVQGDATSSGTFTATSNNFQAEGQQGGNYSAINVPEVTAATYENISNYSLRADGSVFNKATNSVACAAPCGDFGGWTVTGAGTSDVTWVISGNAAPEGSFYVEGKVSISGSPKGPGNTALKLTLVATGSISVTGSPKFTPYNTGGINPEAVQFVTNGDLTLGGTGDFDDPTSVEGQIFVREQIHTQGTWDFQGRIIVQDDADVFDGVTTNSIGGTPTVTYNGTLPDYTTTPSTTYTYNVTGWIEP